MKVLIRRLFRKHVFSWLGGRRIAAPAGDVLLETGPHPSFGKNASVFTEIHLPLKGKAFGTDKSNNKHIRLTHDLWVSRMAKMYY